jgi:hypothetical protein
MNIDDEQFRPVSDYIINFNVRCVYCGQYYSPLNIDESDAFNTPKILINNWCSRDCYDLDSRTR